MAAPLVLLGALVAVLVPLSPAGAAPRTVTPGKAIEAFAPYQPQTTCSPTVKPGTAALRSLVMQAYGGTGDYGIVRACSIGGRSEHKEGRAWDWKVSVSNATQVAQVDDFLRWALATDAYGNRSAQARRLGLMYVIWNHRIWNASSNSWKAYSGSDPHTSHVHLSLSWAGALKKTSYWTARVSGVVSPVPPPAPTPAPAPAPTPRPTGPQPLTAAATMTVSAANPAGATSTFLLQQGERYLLTATGYYRYGPGARLADAECSVHPSDGTWQRRTETEQERQGRGDGGTGDLDLQVQGASTHWSAGDDQRCDTTTHRYVTVLDADTTGRLVLKVQDDVYTDNGGGLRVTVAPFDEGWRR